MNDLTVWDEGRDLFVTTPRIVCGTWWSDNWISRYVRADFDLPAGQHKLVLNFYSPVDIGGTRSLAVRMKFTPLALIEFSEDRGQVDWSHVWQTSSRDSDAVSISLRAHDTFHPPQGDIRQMGVVLTEWHIETQPTSRPGF